MALERLKSHITESHKLHRRIVRHRRGSIKVEGLTPKRSGVRKAVYPSSTIKQLFEAIESLRFAATTDDTISQSDNLEIEKLFITLVIETQNYAKYQPDIKNKLNALLEIMSANNRTKFGGHVDRIISLIESDKFFKKRINALEKTILKLIAPRQQFVIFCSDKPTADRIYQILSVKRMRVVRHSAERNNWMAFNNDPTLTILVCDQDAEEGINLQGGKKFIIHYDMPFNPNRIEQRIGRLDRYGSNSEVTSISLVCSDNPFEGPWVSYLQESLRIFNRSTASLQIPIEKKMQEMKKEFFSKGFEALIDLNRESRGPNGYIEKEIANIENQDALDALSSPPNEPKNILKSIDENLQDPYLLCNWIEGELQLSRIDTDGIQAPLRDKPFCYDYKLLPPRRTLLPKETLAYYCNKAFNYIETPFLKTLRRTSRKNEFQGVQTTDAAIKTYPATYRRSVALSPEGLASQCRILRYGDEFINGIWDITQISDIGVASSYWQHKPDYTHSSEIHLFFRFDFLVEIDLGKAFEVMRFANRLSNSAQAALVRRADVVLPPEVFSIWIDDDLELFTDEEKIQDIENAFKANRLENSSHTFNITPQIWKKLHSCNVRQIIDWQLICFQAQTQAERIFLELPVLKNKISQATKQEALINGGRLSHLRARNENLVSAESYEEWNLEQKLSEAFINGINTPQIRTCAVSSYFLSSNQNIKGILESTQ